jgi:hypothetical protein
MITSLFIIIHTMMMGKCTATALMMLLFGFSFFIIGSRNVVKASLILLSGYSCMSLKREVSQSIANLQHSVKRLALGEEDSG